jgi:hypothetical protein
MMLNNNPRSTVKCVDYLKTLASERTTYIYRGCDLTGTHPFREATFDIWAPEEDTTDYYGQFRPMALGMVGMTTPAGSGAKPMTVKPAAPKGVKQDDLDRLVDARRHGYVENLLAIDEAENNTSVVFCLNWRGWKLLFTGDAEVRSWKTMNKHNVLSPVHFFKVSHHGSANGMPTLDLLKRMLPRDHEMEALLSTYPDVYSGVPDNGMVQMLETQGVKVRSVHDEVETGNFIDIEFPSS